MSRAFHAGEKSKCLSRQFPGGEWASVGQGAVGLSLHITLFFPFLEISQSCEFSGILHPLDDLEHGDKVDVVSSQHLLDELDQFLTEFPLGFQPGGMEVKTKGSAVGGEMTVEVVTEETTELLTSLDVRTGGNHVTTGQRFIKSWIISSIQFVHHDFPNWVRSGWTVLSVTMALVRHTEVQSVGPDGHTAEWGSDGGIVDKELICHHFELLVATNTEERSTNADNATVSDVGESLDDQTVASHLSKPVVISSISPVGRVVLVCNGETGNLVSLTVELLNS